MLPICLQTTRQRTSRSRPSVRIWAREAALAKRRREYPTIQLLHQLAHLLLGLFNAHELPTLFLGSSVLFAVVQRQGRPLLSKYGKYVLLNERRLAQMEAWFARRGRGAVIVGRLIPGCEFPPRSWWG